MAKPRWVASLKRFWLARRKRRSSGFTLIELLVSIIIGAIVTAGLLSLVIELTEVNQRDVSRTETQRDMQAAVDYIAQDLREAVFVYDGACLQGNGIAPGSPNFCPNLLQFLPADLTSNGRVPALAFWRVDPLPSDLADDCRAAANSNTPAASLQALVTGPNSIPCIAGRSYSLVVYAIEPRQANDEWQGRARLVRYKLSQFRDGATSGADRTTGFVDPGQSTSIQFHEWPYLGSATSSQTTRPSNWNDASAVLVDFVDNSPANAANPPNCPTPSQITPSGNTTTIRSFYACVRGQTNDARVNDVTSELGFNQEVLVVLIGNAAGRPGFPRDSSSLTFPIQTRVLTRGIINKQPQENL